MYHYDSELWDDYSQRLGYLEYTETKTPNGFFEAVDNSKRLFREGVSAYLYGLPNASQPTIVRCLEIGINEKYRQEEGEEHTGSLKEKIDWADQFLGEETTFAQGHRELRNLIHENKTVKEVDALETIRHTVRVLNALFPVDGIFAGSNPCSGCGEPISYTVDEENRYLGKKFDIDCDNCGASVRITMLV